MRAWIAGTGAVTLAAALVSPVSADQTISYAGRPFAVPAGWPVVYLTAHPSECVRFDRNAVYLGTPGADQRCPSGLRDVTDAVLIEPDGRVTVSGDRFRSMATPVERAEQPAMRTVQPGVYTG